MSSRAIVWRPFECRCVDGNANFEFARSNWPASGWKKSALRPTSCTGQPTLSSMSSAGVPSAASGVITMWWIT